MRNNLIQSWKQHFNVKERVLKIKGSLLDTVLLLIASGHDDKSDEILVRDIETGNCLRADHLFKARRNELIKSE